MGSKSNNKRLSWLLLPAAIVVLHMLRSFPHAGAQGEEVLKALLGGPKNVNPVDLGNGINYRTEDATPVFKKEALQSRIWEGQIKDIQKLVKQAVLRVVLRPTLLRNLFRYKWEKREEEKREEGRVASVASVLLLAIQLPPLPSTLTNLQTKSVEQRSKLAMARRFVFWGGGKTPSSSQQQVRKPFEGCSKLRLEVVVEEVGKRLLETQVVHFEEGGCIFVLVILVEEEKESQQEGLLGGHIYNNVFPKFSEEVKDGMPLQLFK